MLSDDLHIEIHAPLRSSGASMIGRASQLCAGRVLRAALVLFSLCACGGSPSTPAQQANAGATVAHADFPSPTGVRATSRDSRSASSSAPQPVRTGIGFHSREQLDAHFAKHGREFGQVTRQEYLREAQLLRDAPVGGDIEEIERPDGTISRYDRGSGAFIAFDADGTIRTFFKPNDGEAYFRRQALRSH